MERIVTAVAVLVIVGCVTSLRSYAADEGQDARVQKGKLSYDRYCTPCHGAGGTPGSAVFAATKKPIDLRTYAQRNGGTFPSWKWWDVTFSPQPGAVHTEVWERIRNDQRESKDGKTDLSREGERDITARGVVANIEMYVMSIQNKNKQRALEDFAGKYAVTEPHFELGGAGPPWSSSYIGMILANEKGVFVQMWVVGEGPHLRLIDNAVEVSLK